MSDLIFPTINFVGLVAILFYFGRKPLSAMVRERRAAMKSMVEEAEHQKADAERKFREYEQKLQNYEQEAKQAIDKAKTDAEEMRKKIMSAAMLASEKMIKESEASVRANLEEFKFKIRSEVVNKAVEMSEKIIRDRLSTEDHRRIVNEYVEKV